MPSLHRNWLRTASILLGLSLTGCLDSSTDGGSCLTCPNPTAHLKPSAVVAELVRACKQRNAANYAALLSADFRFYFLPGARPGGSSESWSAVDDSTATARLFNATRIKDVRLALSFDSVDVAVNQLDRETWRRILVTDTFLEVDELVPGEAEILTSRVDGDGQEFYFRKGRTPADTLAGSPTAAKWYLVEWRDLGHPAAARRPGASSAPLPVRAVSWNGIKAEFGDAP